MILARYEPDDWQEWRDLCPDEMCETWEEWNEGVEEATRNRTIVHASTIRPGPYLKWIEETGKVISGYSRSEFAGELMKDRFTQDYKLPDELPKPVEVQRMLRKAMNEDPSLSLSEIFEPYLEPVPLGRSPMGTGLRSKKYNS